MTKSFIVALVLLVSIVMVIPSRAQVPANREAGTICVAAVVDDGDPRGYVSKAFAVRVDKQPWLPVPSDKPTLIADLTAPDKHLLSIRDGNKTIESFWFRFDEHKSRALCLWYKPWYRTWSLWDAADGGPKCRCAM